MNRLNIGGSARRLISLEGKYFPWLLLPAGVVAIALAVVLVWAEERWMWEEAQASLIAILLLLGIVVWGWWRSNRKPPAALSVEAAVYDGAIRKLLVCVAIGFTALILGATRRIYWEEGVVAKAIGYLTVVSGAFFVCGMLLGLLFAFRPTGASQSSDDQSSSARPHPYTNLEEIADWLTKLILGAGLVNLRQMQGPLRQLAYFMAKGVDPLPFRPEAKLGSPTVALAVMGFFSASGVLYGYLWKRYETAVVSDTSWADTSALALVTRWLNAPNTPDDQTRADMMNAIKSASLAAKKRIFLQAEQYRKPSTQDVNDRSLPVFQALVEADLQEIFHRNRGQYALALMGKTQDPKNPDDDWKRALDLLNNATRIRDGSGDQGWREYELARAVCQIHLDPNFKTKQPSNAALKKSILDDLNKATQVAVAVSKAIDSDDVIDAWKKLNP